MKARGGLAILVCALAVLALPASAAAKPGYYVNKPLLNLSLDLKGSNGYSIHVFGLSGNLVWIDNRHIAPMATAPPAALAAISNHLRSLCIRLSLACGCQLADQSATEMPESQAFQQNKKRRPFGRRS